MSWLLEMDHWLFLKINDTWATTWLDSPMSFVTELHRQPLFFGLVLPALLAFWIWRQKIRAIKTLIALTLAVGLGDAVSYRLIKPLIDRDRPEATGLPVNFKTHAHSGKSFPSNHATNMFAAATIMTALYPTGAFAFIGFAALIAYSRVYVGVHFPLDVLGGALLGSTLALLVWLALRRWLQASGWRVQK